MNRGVVATVFGLTMWAVARLSGSAGLHLVAVGITLLPLISWLVGARNRAEVKGERRLSSSLVHVGQRVRVDLTVTNQGERPTSFLLLEDRCPIEFGPPARFVFDRIPRGNSQSISYERVASQRGKYALGPLAVQLSDPFVLTTRQEEVAARSDLLVAPTVEELEGLPPALFGSGRGESYSKQVFRSGDELYAMREYQIGDDLRRIHWPSVARTGTLMIRQDEVARRASAILLLDARALLLGKAHTPAFEKAVSAAASLGRLLAQRGFKLRLALPGEPLAVVDEPLLLERLALVTDSGAQNLRDEQVRAAADAGTTLVVVSGVPSEAGIAQLTRAGASFGRRIAVLVHPSDRSLVPEDRWQELERRASTAQISLTRANWEVSILQPSGSLREIWQKARKPLGHSTP